MRRKATRAESTFGGGRKTVREIGWKPVRGRRNEPAYVVHTVAALAQARGEEPAELEAQIDANATECFRL